MIGYADEVGSGFEKINHLCEKFFKSVPQFEDKDIFKVCIEFKSFDELIIEEMNYKTKIITYIETFGKMTNDQCRFLLNLEKTRVNQIINSLLEDKSIYRHGKGRATFYDLNE
jgi:predicted HTH transcriptional regulator